MGAVLTDVADAVVALLVAGNTANAFTPSISPVRGYDVKLLLDDLDVLRCDVVASSRRVRPISRLTVEVECDVDIGIRKKFTAADIGSDGKVLNASVDALVHLLEQIEEYIATAARKRLATPKAGWLQSVVLAPWDSEHLLQSNQFTGITRVTYRVQRDLT
jgi:hypothetical protein